MQGWGQERCHYTELLSVAARSGDLFALEVVPVPAEVTKPVEVYSGFCGRLSIGSLPIIPAGAGGASLSLYVGMGICDYFPPYAGMRIAMGADVLFYYLSGGSLEKPSVTNRLVGARAWTSIGLDPEK